MSAAPQLKDIWRDSFQRLCAPRSRMTLSEWADTYRIIPAGTSAYPGPWRTDRTPYLREIMDAVTNPDIEEVAVMGPSQFGKTDTALNVIGYHIHQQPEPMLLVQPTKDMANDFSKGRLATMIENTPVLAELVSEAKSRDAGNTMSQKLFPGGDIALVGANSPAGLAMRPRCVVIFDEIDRFPESAGREGDPITIGSARTETYRNRKLIYLSSPTFAGNSRIEQVYLITDKRRRWTPCGHCGEFQILEFEHVLWPGRDDKDAEQEPDQAVYICQKCGGVINESMRLAMLHKAEWRAGAKLRRAAGFWMSGLDSTLTTMASLAGAYVKAHSGNEEQIKAFENTKLARLYRVKGEAPDTEKLYERRESYPIGIVPDGGGVLTAAVDVQIDRLECEVKAWGKGSESWSVEHIIIPGSVGLDDVWNELTKILHRTWKNSDGRRIFRLARMFVDSGSYTDLVYSWAEKVNDPTRLYVGKGQWNDIGRAIGSPSRPKVDSRGKTVKRSVMLWPIGSSYCKSAVYSRLRLAKPEPGEPAPRYMHFPQYGREWFEQLTAEQLVTESDKRGFAKRVWVKTRARNEALDLQAYNFAMMISLGLESKPDDFWDLSIGAAETEAAGIDTAPTTTQPTARINRVTGRKRGDFW